MSLATVCLASMNVSRLGFGTLSLSPLQSSLTPEQGAELLCYAWHKGINFWDTAQIYQNYPVLALALKEIAGRPIIATKTYAYTARQAEADLAEARQALNRDVDIILLHEQTALTLDGHLEALDWLAGARARGMVQAVGVSTHSVACVAAAAALPQVDVIHPLYNFRGIGIVDGDAGDMAAAIELAHSRGKGIYGMKILGGGTLYREAARALRHGFSRPWLDSIVIGMSARAEIDFNVALASGELPSSLLAEQVRGRRRRLHIATWCQGCGSCLSACDQGALSLVGGRVKVDENKCILCGYCCRNCEHMCLKLV